MAQTTVVPLSGLADGLILAPERYDPRRRLHAVDGPSLGELVGEVREPASRAQQGACLVADTTHAKAGVLTVAREPMACAELGSAKKRVRRGDVIISRLRPYLRQVAWIDDDADGTLVVSPEFYVLRSRSPQSIAFLVPYLLSRPVQDALAAAQEGGHHPRFSAETLLALPVPRSSIKERDALSDQVVAAVQLRRRADADLAAATARAQAQITGS